MGSRPMAQTYSLRGRTNRKLLLCRAKARRMLLLKQFIVSRISLSPLESEVIVMYITLSNLDISPAIVNVLAEASITSREELKHMTEKELREAGRKIGKENAVVRAAEMALKRIRELKRQERATDKFREEKKTLNGRPLEYLKLSLHSKQCLHNADIDTVEELLSCSEQGLNKLHTLGKKGIKEIKEKLKAKGLALSIFNKGQEKIYYMADYKKKQGVMYGHPNARRMRKHLRQKLHHQRRHHQPCIEEYIDDFSD